MLELQSYGCTFVDGQGAWALLEVLQDADVGRVCVRARIRLPTAAELAHAKSMLGMLE